MSISLRKIFQQKFEGHKGRPGRVGGSLPRSGGSGGVFESDKDYKAYSKGRQAGVVPELADVDMVGGHLDFRQLGERSKFPITSYGVPSDGQEIDFYDINGDKKSGKVNFTDEDKNQIFISVVNPRTGRFDGEGIVLDMVDWKTGEPMNSKKFSGRRPLKFRNRK